MDKRKETIIQLVYEAVDEVNRVLPKGQRIKKSLATALMGESAKLDSLGIVNLIVSFELKISQKTGVTVTLADEKAMSKRNSPFITIGALVEYASKLIDGKPTL